MAALSAMGNTYRPRRILTVLAALALPAATCGVAPALQDLMQRMQRVERFMESAQLPPVLMDDHGIVIGPVLEYNDLMLYTSAGRYWDGEWPLGYATPGAQGAVATVQLRMPGAPGVILEANREELSTPSEGARVTWFESADCSGQPWKANSPWVIAFGPERDTLWYESWIGAPGSTLYVVGNDEQLERADLRSQILSLGPFQGHCDASESIETNAVRMHRVYDLGAFTPPFQIVDQRELWVQ